MLTSLLAAIAAVRADPNPTVPGPGDKYNAGATCHIEWDPDTTGQWKVMNIQLMTGNNFAMVPLTSTCTPRERPRGGDLPGGADAGPLNSCRNRGRNRPCQGDLRLHMPLGSSCFSSSCFDHHCTHCFRCSTGHASRPDLLLSVHLPWCHWHALDDAFHHCGRIGR